MTRADTAALYCRLSRRPDDGKVMTVAEQEKHLRQVAADRGLTVVGSYVDNGVSAYKRVQRPGFSELVAAIERREVGWVLMVALDRATRRVADLAAIREAAEDADVMLVANGRLYHPRDDALSLYLFGIVAEQESRDKSRRVLDAKAKSLERCLYAGGRRPFGYRKPEGAARGYWTQDPDEAKAIRDGARMILRGKSLIDVAQEWNRRGIARAQTERPWSVSKVKRALASPIVAGLRTHKGETVGTLMRPDGTPWPAILTSEKRTEIERTLRSRYGRKPSRWHSPNPALLSGLAVCGVCDHNLTPRRYGGRRPDGYSCQADGGGRCGGVGISMPKLDALIEDAALVLLDSAKLRRALARPRKESTGEDPALLDSELEELAAAAGTGAITVREFLVARKPLEERRDRALAALDDGDDRVALAPVLHRSPREAWRNLDLDAKRAVLAVLLDRVVIHPANGATTFDPDRVQPIWRY